MRVVVGVRLGISVLVWIATGCASKDAVFERPAVAGSANAGGAGGSGGARAGGAPGAGGATANEGGAGAGASLGGASSGGAASGQGGVNTGGGSGGGGAIGGGGAGTYAPPCATVTTLEACELRVDCHSVFADFETCGCLGVGCCAKFSDCADGDLADCKGDQVECDAKTPSCESPAFVVSFVGFCYEGCVAPKDCAP
jgi:hypothetical protein